MALIKCQECGQEISDEVVACPKCGYPLKTETKKPWLTFETTPTTWKDVIAILIFCLFGVLLIFLLSKFGTDIFKVLKDIMMNLNK